MKRRGSGPSAVAALPWWAWLALGAACGLVLNAIANAKVEQAAGALARDRWMILMLLRTLASFAQFALPGACCIAAAASWLENRERHDSANDAVEPSVGDRAALEIDRGAWSLELLHLLEWRRFEELCQGYFQALGFDARISRVGADGGVDLRLHRVGEDRPCMLVQCKAWKVYQVGVKPVRELFGVMASEGVAEGVFVTSGAYTLEAREFASRHTLHLIDGEDFLAKIAALPAPKREALLRAATAGDFITPTCPSCGVRMVRRESEEGREFWGCINFPRCRSTLKG